MKISSFNIFPILRVAKRYQLDSERLFSIIMDFLSHRREEILNAQLSKWFSPFDVEIKRDLHAILYQLINELDYSDTVNNYFIKNSYFYIEEHTHEHEQQYWE